MNNNLPSPLAVSKNLNLVNKQNVVLFQSLFYNNKMAQVWLYRDAVLEILCDGHRRIIQLLFEDYFTIEVDRKTHISSLLIHKQANKQLIKLHHDDTTIIKQFQEILEKHINRHNFSHIYLTLCKLGKGITAEVMLVEQKITKQRFAAKVIQKSSIKNLKQKLALINQIKIMNQLDSNIFVKLKHFFSEDHHFIIVTERAQGMNLKEIIESKKENLDRNQKKNIIEQVCQGIQILSQKGIIHRDIKPENIIYNSKTKKIKIIDFGFATHITNTSHIYEHCGTPGYTAPEALNKQNPIINLGFDIFSAGVFMHYLYSGKIPYDMKNNILRENKNGKFVINERFYNQDYSKEVNLMKKMLSQYQKRASIDQILRNELFNIQSTNQQKRVLSKMLQNGISIEKSDLIKVNPSSMNLNLMNMKIERKNLQSQRIMKVQLRNNNTEMSLNKIKFNRGYSHSKLGR